MGCRRSCSISFSTYRSSISVLDHTVFSQLCAVVFQREFVSGQLPYIFRYVLARHISAHPFVERFFCVLLAALQAGPIDGELGDAWSANVVSSHEQDGTLSSGREREWGKEREREHERRKGRGGSRRKRSHFTLKS